MTPASRTTGAVTALLVFLGIGLFGQMGWLGALVLALIAGGLLALMVAWLGDPRGVGMDGPDWDAMPLPPQPVAAAPVRQAPAPAAAPEIAPSGDAIPPAAPRETPDAARSIYAGGPDDLRAIKGIGPKVQQALEQAGVTRFAQIAAWDDADVDRMAAGIGRAASRIRNDDWVGQARALASRRQEAG